jgi:hypothetical protein
MGRLYRPGQQSPSRDWRLASNATATASSRFMRSVDWVKSHPGAIAAVFWSMVTLLAAYTDGFRKW